MAKTTGIAWTDSTFNPWIGCTKVGPGCDSCYAEAMDARKRWGGVAHWGIGVTRHRTSAAYWRQPIRWNEEAKRSGKRHLVFCASLADVFDNEVDPTWRPDLWDLIRETPHLDWLLLTKRPENWAKRMSAVFRPLFGGDHPLREWLAKWAANIVPTNVWIGTTVEDQARADERIPRLLEIPARVRFLSCEPMLTPINLAYTCFNGSYSFGRMPGVDWVIIGGESGPGARPFHTEHAWDLLQQCRTAGVAPFVKQLGANPVTSNANAMEWPDKTMFYGVAGSGVAAGASVKLGDKKGGDQAEWPEELRVQEFPPNNGDEPRLCRENQKL